MHDHVALMIRDSNNFLFIKRSKLKKTLPGIWAFPSGTKEESENIYQTALREAYEELGVIINVEKTLAVKELPEFNVRLHFLVCTVLSGEAFIKDTYEIEELSWLTFKEFFLKYSDSEIGHGLVFLRNNFELWKEYS